MAIEAPDEPISQVYFPIDGVGSIIAIGLDGRRIEAGLFGREGMSGTPILTGVIKTPNETVIQVPGNGLRIECDRLRELLAQNRSLHDHFLLFLQAQIAQTSQTALSNGRAKLEERLARWLLMCHDRIEGDTMKLTHEFLSVMLGVRRAGVTVGTHLLEGKHLIKAKRGEITVLDREGLEAQAGGSYGVPEAEYERLIADPHNARH